MPRSILFAALPVLWGLVLSPFVVEAKPLVIGTGRHALRRSGRHEAPARSTSRSRPGKAPMLSTGALTSLLPWPPHVRRSARCWSPSSIASPVMSPSSPA